jgi:Ca2+-binding RTX toxin-like protein
VPRLAVLCVLACLLAPQSALAGPCELEPDSGVLTIQLVAGSTDNVLFEDTDGNINFTDSSGSHDPCGGAQTASSNITSIRVVGGAESELIRVELLTPHGEGDFGPARDGSPHVPIELQLGAARDYLVIEGSAYDDTVSATPSGIHINQAEGPDITGDPDECRIFGWDGDDELSLELGAFVDGGFQNPHLGFVDGGEGNDTLRAKRAFGWDGNDELHGLDGSNLIGGGGDDVLVGSPYDDQISDGDGDDAVSAGHGHDALEAGYGRDTLSGGEGSDRISYQRSESLLLTDTGTPVSGSVTENESDTIEGDVEELRGGTGNDTIIAAGQVRTIRSGAGDDVVEGSPSHDLLHGDNGGDTIRGGGGWDTIYGGDDNDTIDEGASTNGADQFFGGRGFDTLSYEHRAGSVRIDLDIGPNDGELNEGDNVNDQNGGSLERFLGGAAGDTFVTGHLGYHFAGRDGDDRFIMVGFGTDVVSGGPGRDSVDYSGHSDDLRIRLDGSATSGALWTPPDGNPENDTLHSDIENAAGGAGDDVLSGNPSGNYLTGKSGLDTINGGSGADLLEGGTNDDYLFGGSDGDRLVPGTGSDVVAAGPGDDRIEAVDRRHDTAWCGRGTDRARLDAIDRRSSCEVLLRS